MRPLILVPTINYRHWNACYLQLLSVDCTEMPAPPTGRALLLGGGPDPPSSRALLLGGGSAMALDVQGGYRAVCGRSFSFPAFCRQPGSLPSSFMERGELIY